MYFSDIPAPSYLKDRLLYMAQQKQVPHAHLFWGPVGNAALPLALAFTTYLTCHHPSAEDACGTCKSCLQLGKFTHPDVKFIFPTLTAAAASASGASGSNVLAAWSAFLQEQPYGHLLDWSNYIGTSKSQPLITKAAITELTQYILLNALESNYKVNLIWLPEYMHPAAAHALLKILEEPTAAQVVFLLISHSPENLLGTIRSRLQQMYIPPFTDEAMQQIITQHYQQQLSDTADVATIIKLAAGNAQKAYQLITNNQNDLMQHFTHWMRSCYAYDFSKVLATVDVFHEYEKATQKHFLVYSVWMLRQIWIARLQVTQLLKVQQPEKEIIQKLGTILDEGTIQQMNAWIQQAHFCIERNVNPKIVFLNLSLKVVQRFKTIRKQ
jgi:DNA polymerase-3 subunit delta'